MKSLLSLLLLLMPTTAYATRRPAELTYTISMNPARFSHVFQVRLLTPKLSSAQAVYQFAATAPGTYVVVDMGRYVSDFRAFDAKGRLLPTSHIGPNQWKLAQPEKTQEIRYTVAETWVTPMSGARPGPMFGSSLESDHALINGQTVLGYPQGWQSKPIRIKLVYPGSWQVGTGLKLDSAGYYHAHTYDEAVDSPFLLGHLTSSTIKLGKQTLHFSLTP